MAGASKSSNAWFLANRVADRHRHHSHYCRDRNAQFDPRSHGGESNFWTIESQDDHHRRDHIREWIPARPRHARRRGSGNLQCRDSARRYPDAPPYRKSGYQLSYQAEGAPIPNPPPACANAGFNAYVTTAVPVVVGQTRQTSYCSDEPGIIHYDSSGLQAASPPLHSASSQ